MNKVFNKIKEAREKLGLTQLDFAVESGVNRSDISKLENGEKKFIDISIVQYLNSKGFDMNSLFDDSIENVRMISQKTNEGVGKDVYGLLTEIKVLKESLKDKERIIKLHERISGEPDKEIVVPSKKNRPKKSQKNG